MKNTNKVESARSWFCVLNNPQSIFGDISPDEMVNKAIEIWADEKPHRSCGINYEIGDSGNHHMHMVLEDSSKVRFSTIQKLFKGIHIEPTRGSKEQALDYIYKRGIFEEKNHTVVVPAVIHGEIKANRGKRKDLEIISEMIDSGMTPNEIYDIDICYRQYEKMIKGAYYRKRYLDTPKNRDIKVYWHVGESGSGKSYSYVGLCEKHGNEKVYFMNDYDNGGFDNYCGEPILFLDEFKGNLPFSKLLNYLDKYPVQVHCRYTNSFALWSEVHITSIFYPEEVYKNMVSSELQDRDKIDQLLRRITSVCIHEKDGDKYLCHDIPIDEYRLNGYKHYRKSYTQCMFVNANDSDNNPFVKYDVGL